MNLLEVVLGLLLLTIAQAAALDVRASSGTAGSVTDCISVTLNTTVASNNSAVNVRATATKPASIVLRGGTKTLWICNAATSCSASWLKRDMAAGENQVFADVKASACPSVVGVSQFVVN